MRLFRLISFLILLFGLSRTGTAQVSLRIEVVKPVGDLGRRFKPGPGITLMYGPYNSIRRVNGLFYAGLFRLTPQWDTLASAYSLVDFRNTFVPGYEVYEPYLYCRAGTELTYRLYVDEPFTPIGLLNIGGIWHTQKYSSNTGSASTDSHLAQFGIEGGLGAGVEYEVNKSYSTRLSVSHNVAVYPEYGLDRYWTIGLNGIYYW